MRELVEKAYAKINLTLGVRGKRTDGYHELDMLMQSIDLYDTVTVEKASDVNVVATGSFIPFNNTLRKAAELYQSVTGRGANIRIHKSVPSQAGLGGGSGDAAAVLRALDKLYGETDQSTLYEIAQKVGADVPFCLHGGLCRAEGTGEILTPIKGTKLHLVITKPDKGVSTKALFEALTLPREMPKTTEAMAALAKGDLKAVGGLLFNALEDPAVALVPEIETHRKLLLENGALGARMTGSGSAVFGIFETKEEAEKAAQTLSYLPFCKAVESV